MDRKPVIKRARLDETSSDNIDNALLEKDSDSTSATSVAATANATTADTDSANANGSQETISAPTHVTASSQSHSNVLESTVADAVATVVGSSEFQQSVLPRQPPSSSTHPFNDSNESVEINNSTNTSNNNGEGPSITVGSTSFKPSAGTEEWHKIRRDNHKEVERRRREAINQGINELAAIVPDCDKHKGQILKNTVDYIKKLKDNEQRNMEKLTLEKLLTEQAIAELSATNKALKTELAQAWKEVEHWKRACGEDASGNSNDAGSANNGTK